ncbi:hypothetical protein [uncultured Shewanella sp.]|uniref:hypothetical protein n=1 Tax=uncultured Shewanella sp. TaxID=173975 RepID=UPI002633D1DE|nr:hypothetical protein [uncultured Shewanella sp.]
MKKLSALSFALLLAACGSDDSPSIPPSISEPEYENLDVKVDTKETFNGEVTVYLGRHRNCDYYPQYCTKDGRNLITPDDSKYIIKVSADELKRKYPESINKELFSSGNYSALDVLRYVADTRKDLHFELGEFNQEIGTYEFNVSWDRNGDGNFTSLDNIDSESNLNSPDWYARFMYDEGESMREGSQASLEVLYDRLDEFPVRNNLFLRFESFSHDMTERRQSLQRKQVDRLEQHGGVVLPELLVNFGKGAGDEVIARDIPVSAHNIRTDIFTEGTHTAMDLLLSADDEGLVDFQFNYWPQLHLDTNVGSYGLVSINGQRAKGLAGWLLRIGEKETFTDFFDPIPLDNGAGVIANIKAAGPKYCSWLIPDGQHTDQTAMQCYEEWGNLFGGAFIHRMTDVIVNKYPVGVVQLFWLDAMNKTWNPTEQNIAGDGKFPVYDISKAIAPLEESHFGWKVADCGMCHSLDNIHLDGDSPALPGTIEPYFCASCHGNNGATAGHGETSHCFWCHSKDQKMPNHGDASIERVISEIACVDRNTGEPDDGNKGPCSTVLNMPAGTLVAHDRAGNYESEFPDIKYSNKITTMGNGDWHTSQTFPDPYACVTCHVNQ